MATADPKTPQRRPSRDGTSRKKAWLDPKALLHAQEILGTATESEPVDEALDMIVFRQELLDGARALADIEIDSFR